MEDHRSMNRLLFLLALAIALGGCVVGSYQPITPAREASTDPALLGTWLPVAPPGKTARTGPTEIAYQLYHVGKHEDGHSYRIQDIRLDAAGHLKNEVIIGHGSVLNGQQYLNLITEYEDKRAYMLVRYTVNQDHLVLYSVNDDIYQQHLNTGLITEDPREEGILTMPSDKLYSYLKHHGATLLSEVVGHYVRGQSLDD
jgi:hypothetical protein